MLDRDPSRRCTSPKYLAVYLERKYDLAKRTG